jgi:hypothetical protein
MIARFKLFESRYKADNIDKKYYLWKLKTIGYDNLSKNKFAVIEIVNIDNNIIKYKEILNSKPSRNINYNYADFFTGKQDLDELYGNDVSLSFWKRNMSEGLLYGTNDKQAAFEAYDLYLQYPNLTPEEFELYRDAKKYNL